MSECISCIKDGVTGVCRDIKDKTARKNIEEVTNKLNEVIENVNQLAGLDGGHLATDQDIAEINGKLEDYAKTSEVNTTLEDYAKTSEINEKLEDYAKTSEVNTTLEDYAKTSEVDTKLNDYVKKSDNAQNSGLSLKIESYNSYTLTNLYQKLIALNNSDPNKVFKLVIRTDTNLYDNYGTKHVISSSGVTTSDSNVKVMSLNRDYVFVPSGYFNIYNCNVEDTGFTRINFTFNSQGVVSYKVERIVTSSSGITVENVEYSFTKNDHYIDVKLYYFE